MISKRRNVICVCVVGILKPSQSACQKHEVSVKYGPESRYQGSGGERCSLPGRILRTSRRDFVLHGYINIRPARVTTQFAIIHAFLTVF